MLYIKIDPCDRVTHYNTSSQKIGVSGPLKKFEGLLTYYISKLILVIGGPWNVNLSSLKDCWHVIYQNWLIEKLIATYCIRRLVGQGPTSHLKRGHRAHLGLLKRPLKSIVGILYIGIDPTCQSPASGLISWNCAYSSFEAPLRLDGKSYDCDFQMVFLCLQALSKVFWNLR